MGKVKSGATEVNYTKAKRLFEKLAKTTGRSMDDILRQGGRVGAMVMADNGTFPQGFGNEFRAATQKSIIGGLAKLFASRKKMFDLMEQRIGKAGANRFAHYMESEQFVKARQMAEKYLGITIRKTINPQEHRQNMRNRRPIIADRFAKAPVVGIWEFDKVVKYAKQVGKTIGRAKAGWLTIARQLGGTRKLRGQTGGISGTLKRDGEGIQQLGGSRDKPFILLTNKVPYIDQLNNAGAKAYAAREALSRMMAFARSALRAAAKQARAGVPA